MAINKKKFSLKTFVLGLIVLFLAIFGIYFIVDRNNSESKEDITDNNTKAKVSNDHVLFVTYDGRTYYETDTIDSNNFESLKEQHLGKSIYESHENPNTDNKTNQIISNLGELDIYSVKGYDADYRIMASFNNTIYFFECYSGTNVNVGKDIFDKFNLKDKNINVSYNLYNEIESKIFNDTEIVKTFIDKLYIAKSVDKDDLNLNIYDKDFILLNIELSDKTIIEIRLFEDGYVATRECSYIFEMDINEFNELYLKLK